MRYGRALLFVGLAACSAKDVDECTMRSTSEASASMAGGSLVAVNEGRDFTISGCTNCAHSSHEIGWSPQVATVAGSVVLNVMGKCSANGKWAFGRSITVAAGQEKASIPDYGMRQNCPDNTAVTLLVSITNLSNAPIRLNHSAFSCPGHPAAAAGDHTD